jgi:hypothetical protein
MLTNESLITVYNENKGAVYAEGLMDRQYKFEAIEDDTPFETIMPLSDIKHINSRSAVFRDGILRIEPEKEDEVFKVCGIVRKSENYITTEEIEDIIINPTAEKLQRFLEVTSPVTMDKIRNTLVELDNTDEYDISVRVFDVVNNRMKEINVGKRKSDIIIKKKKNEAKNEKSSKKTNKKSTDTNE